VIAPLLTESSRAVPSTPPPVKVSTITHAASRRRHCSLGGWACSVCKVPTRMLRFYSESCMFRGSNPAATGLVPSSPSNQART